MTRSIIGGIFWLIMKERIEEITGLLGRTEGQLRQMIADAAKAGDYRTVDLAKTAAVGIQNLQTGISNPGAKLQPKPASSVGKAKTTSRRGGKGRYPKFDVKKNTLNRIGWSKKERREYTHKTPRTAFDRTVKVMAALAQNGAGPFTAEQIIEQLNHMGSETIPSYQVYVVIGFLRARKCIVQVGREGYDIPVDVYGKAEAVWRSRSGEKV